ncbi:MAG: hypothetical protein V4794_11925 [Pseudomonadota bacterium]
MRQHLAKSLLVVAVTTTALAGCGGGGGDDPAPAPPQAASPFMGTTVQSLLDYMNQLIAQTSETSEPEPVDNTPLPVDDTV